LVKTRSVNGNNSCKNDNITASKSQNPFFNSALKNLKYKNMHLRFLLFFSP